MFQQYKQKQLQINKIIYLYKQKKSCNTKKLNYLPQHYKLQKKERKTNTYKFPCTHIHYMWQYL